MSRSADAQMKLFQPPPAELPSYLPSRLKEPVPREEFDQIIDERLARSLEYGTPLTLITADITALKAVNDELGHEEGDALIMLVESAVHSVADTLRHGDTDRRADVISVDTIQYEKFEDLQPQTSGSTAARVGGDEFRIIAETDEAGAEAIAERIIQITNDTLAGPKGEKMRKRGIKAGVAVGVATVNSEIITSSDLKRASDQSMYANKMSQLIPLTPDQQEHLLAGLVHLREARIRPRDLPRYVEWLGAQALLETELESDEDL